MMKDYLEGNDKEGLLKLKIFIEWKTPMKEEYPSSNTHE